MKKSIVAASAAALALGAVLWHSSAQAQEAPYLRQPLPAPSRALEVQAGFGYTQGFGQVLPNTGIPSVAGAGLGFTADVGYRIHPRWSIELEGQYQQFTGENATSSNGFNANIGATFHMLPAFRGDPWFRFGAGWRSVWQHGSTAPFGFAPANSTNGFHGFQLATIRFGYDVRATQSVAVAPFVGADLQAFFWQNGNQLPNAQWGSFVYAGVQGRIDFGGASNSLARR